MKKFIKKILNFTIFGPLFQREPFLGYITSAFISPLKIYKKKYKSFVFRYNIASSEVYSFIRKFWWDSKVEIATYKWFEQNLKDNDVFLNVGAHIGTFIVFTNKVKKLKKTICIEASSSNVSQLMVNININDVKNTDIYHCAAGDRDEFVEFTYDNLQPGSYNGRALDFHYLSSHKKQRQGSEFVQMKKIDNIFKEHKLPYPNIILMDIDGHEQLALKGMEEIISNKHLRNAIIETNKKTDTFVVEFMKKHGFITIYEYASQSVNNRVFERG